jgi:hypothetical protein
MILGLILDSKTVMAAINHSVDSESENPGLTPRTWTGCWEKSKAKFEVVLSRTTTDTATKIQYILGSKNEFSYNWDSGD